MCLSELKCANRIDLCYGNRKMLKWIASPNHVPSWDMVIQLSWDCRFTIIRGQVSVYTRLLVELLDYVYIESFLFAQVRICQYFRSSTNQIEITINKKARVRKYPLTWQDLTFVELCGRNNNIGCDMLFCTVLNYMLACYFLRCKPIDQNAQ